MQRADFVAIFQIQLFFWLQDGNFRNNFQAVMYISEHHSFSQATIRPVYSRAVQKTVSVETEYQLVSPKRATLLLPHLKQNNMNQNKNLRAKIIYRRFWGTNFLDLFITFFQREVQFYHSWCENTKALSKHLTIVIFIKQHVKIFKENFICDEYF